MPCGGIYPVQYHFSKDYIDKPPLHGDTTPPKCFFCGKNEPKVDHFCDEWDCYLHRDCIDEFLKTDEGKCVLNHKHEVLIQLKKEGE